MTHPFSFQGSLMRYWEVLYAEYQRLSISLGQPPFEFTPSNPQTMSEYIPKNGDEIIIYFWDKEHRHTLLVVEAELLPDEDVETVNVIVHPQGNPFEEPVKSVMSIWKEIKTALERKGRRSYPLKSNQRKQSASNVTNIYVAGDVNRSNIIVGDENTIEITKNVFKPIYDAIDKAHFKGTEKDELIAEVIDIENEVAKGDKANESFLSRRLRNLKNMTPDIADVALSALTGPGTAISAIVKKVAGKISTENKKTE